MSNLLALSTTTIGIIGGIVGAIVLSIIMHYINRAYRIRYNYSLFGGGFFMLIAEGGIALGVITLTGILDNKLFMYVGFGVAALIILIILIVNIKRCGFGAGLGAIFLQIIFSVPCLLLLFELLTGNKTSGSSFRPNYAKEKRIREERGYDNNNNTQRNRNDNYYDL